MKPDNPAPILVFDINETLLDITTLTPVFERIFGDPSVMRTWFAQLILYSQTMTLSGLYTPFGDLALGALRMVAEIHNRPISKSDLNDLKDRISAMPALPDVKPSLTRLRDAGYQLVTLTNSAPSASPTPLQRAGLDDLFERNFSVEAVRKFKPAPETYRHVSTEMGAEASDLCLVACHFWDAIGAQAAGCRGALLTRPHNAVLPAGSVPQPDFIAPNLDDLAR